MICVSFLPYLLLAQGHTIRRKAQTKPKVEKRNANNKMSNRIARNINGITLGVSTQQDVISKLKARRMEYTEYADGYVIISNGKHYYMGIEWEAVMYKFYQNKVWAIIYITGDKKGAGNNLPSLRSTVTKACNKKYRRFYSSSQIGTYYSDSITGILIQNNSISNQDISLIIGDIAISNLLGTYNAE